MPARPVNHYLADGDYGLLSIGSVPGTGYALEDSRKSEGFHGYLRRKGGGAPSSLTEVERLL